MVQFWTSYGKYFTSMEHELRKMAIESHVTLPEKWMLTLELIELASALKQNKSILKARRRRRLIPISNYVMTAYINLTHMEKTVS